MSTEDIDTSSPPASRVATLGGWLLIAAFAGVGAYLGDIESHARLFQAGYVLGFVGYGLLVWCVWGRRPPGRWGWWLAGCIVVRILIVGVAPSDDLYRYLWEGRVQLAGHNPFVAAPDDPVLADLRDSNWRHINHRDYPAIYPPLAQFEFYVMARVSPTIEVFKNVHVFFDVIAIVLLAWWLRCESMPPHRAIIYGLCPLTLTAFGVEGHLDSVMLALLVAAGLAITHRRSYLCAVLLAAAILTKLVPVVLLPWLLWKHRYAGILCLLLVAVGYIPYSDAGTALFGSLLRFMGHTQLLGLGYSGLSLALDGQVARGLGVLVVVSVAMWHARRGVSMPCYMVSTFGTLVLFMPVVHYWYLTWVLIALPFVPRVSWLVLMACMVFYFEAYGRRAALGEWSMPTWVPYFVYAPFLAAWVAEHMIRRSQPISQRRTMGEGDP